MSDSNKSYKEKLNMLRMIHGKEVQCTDGLFHLYDSKHNEVYINQSDGAFDKRGIYNTLVVLDNVIVAKVVNNDNIKFVVLTKDNLECVYKTKGNIFYIDKYLVCDKYKDDCMLISHSGKHTWRYDNTICINKIFGNNYLVSSNNMFQDKILHYNKHKDTIRDTTANKRYAIHRINDSKISIVPMNGGKYTYDFETRICMDEFNDKQIDTVTLFCI